MEQFEVPEWDPGNVVIAATPNGLKPFTVVKDNPLFSEAEVNGIINGKALPVFDLKAVKEEIPPVIDKINDQIKKAVANEITQKEFVIGPNRTASNGFGAKNEQQTVDEINSKIEDEIEVVKPEYVDPRFVDNISRKPMYRLQQGKFRHYFTFTNPADVQGMQGQVYRPIDFVKFYPSVTTIIGYRQPESEFLLEMISKMGLVEFRKWFGLTAKFGTLDHILSLEHLASGVTADKRYLNFDLIPQRVEDYIAKHKLDVNHYAWIEKIQQDMLAFRQFYIDYNVVPLAIEALGYWDDGIYRFGGALDIICEMDYTEKGYFGEIYKTGAQKGQPKESKQTKRITAIIDLKSGRNGFREEHREQLVMYDMIAEKCFGIKVDRLYNVSPKDWTAKPDYHLKDQTDGRTLGKIPHLLGLFFDDYKGPKDIKIISGSLTGTQDYSDVCRKVNAHDFIFQKMYNKQNNQNLLKSN